MKNSSGHKSIIKPSTKRVNSPTKGQLVSDMMEYSSVVRQRDELRIRIQHLLHLLQDSQTAFDQKSKENQVLRHALSQESNAADRETIALDGSARVDAEILSNLNV